MSRLLISLIVFSAVANLSAWAIAWWLFPRDTAAAVLHYSSGIGIDLIGQGTAITLLPLVGTILLVANGILGWSVRRAAPEAAWVLWTTLPVVQLALLIAVIVLERLNA